MYLEGKKMNKELFPDDAQERAKLNKLIEELQSKEFFGYDYFNEVRMFV